jgi:hypothetical protein
MKLVKTAHSEVDLTGGVLILVRACNSNAG